MASNDVKVGEILGGNPHKGAIVIPIYFNKKGKHFWGRVGESDRADGETIEVVEKALRDKLKALLQIEWIPVIEVQARNITKGREYLMDTASLYLAYKRMYVGQTPKIGANEAAWKYTTWDQTPEYRMYNSHAWSQHKEGELSLPFQVNADAYSFERGRTIYYLAYTEELWNGLEAVRTSLEAANKRLHDLLGSPDGQVAIATVGSQLLLALPGPQSE